MIRELTDSEIVDGYAALRQAMLTADVTALEALLSPGPAPGRRSAEWAAPGICSW